MTLQHELTEYKAIIQGLEDEREILIQNIKDLELKLEQANERNNRATLRAEQPKNTTQRGKTTKSTTSKSN